MGQLVREKLGLGASFSVGFSTYDGSVSAARRWDGARETMSVNPGLAESYEQLLHEVSFRTPQPASCCSRAACRPPPSRSRICRC